MKTILNVFILIILLNTVSFADIIHIPTDINSIQGGINIASEGDTVLVQPGTYVENINFKGKNIVVGSMILITGDTSYISRTVIDGNQTGSVVTFENGENSTTVLSGFTLRNGSGRWSGGQAEGGGIFLNNNSSPNLVNLIITENVAKSANGAGICCWNNSNCTIENVTVTRNDGSGDADTNDGCGGILVDNSSPIMKNVSITDNIGLMAGGLFCQGYSNPVLFNVTIAGNKASGSGWYDNTAALVCWGVNSSTVLVNCVLWNESLTEILMRNDEDVVTIAHSDIQGGEDGIVKDGLGRIAWLDGNINSDPLFIDQSKNDYRLSQFSPCIDAGIQDTFLVVHDNLFGINIPQMSYFGDAPDMGAFETGNIYFVTNTDDSGEGSLRSTIANASSGAEIVFDLNLPISIQLSSQLIIEKDITISGPKSTDLTISGSSKDRVFFIEEDLNVSISNIIICDGFITGVDFGGGIFCTGSNLSLSNVRLTNNYAHSGGGLIGFNSILDLNNVLIDNNVVWDDGGGIATNFGCDIKLTNVKIIENVAFSEGGGIESIDSDYEMANVSLFNNSAESGGGIFSRYGNSFRFDEQFRCNIYSNTAKTGNDLYNEDNTIFSVFVDTFTVLEPSEAEAYPISMFTFDIFNSVITDLTNIDTDVPRVYALRQNYPNPFNPTTTIEFDLPKSADVKIDVYNATGEEVQSLLKKKMSSGHHEIRFNAENLSSGVYFYRIQAGEYQDVKKMVLLR